MVLSVSRRRTCARRTSASLYRSVGLALAFMVALSAETAAADAGPEFAFLSWTSKGPSTHETHFGPTTGLMLFTTVGNDIVRPKTVLANDPAFVSEYASELPAMGFENSAGNSADGLAQMIFSPPLPAGARLIVIDVDIANRNERVEITTVGGMLELLTQAETRAGANSAFPTWNPQTGVLQSVQDNLEEATIFDVGGVEGLAMRYLRNSGGRGVTGVHFAIAIPVPEPQSAALLGIAGVASLRFGRRRVRNGGICHRRQLQQM